MGIKLTKEDIKNRTFCIMVLQLQLYYNNPENL